MPQSLKLLVIEAIEADFLRIQRQLRKQGMEAQLHRVRHAQALAAALAEGSWDAVLSNYSVPGMEFVTTFSQLRAANPELPVILVSATVGEERAIELFRLGIADFVPKDHLARLVPAIMRALQEAREWRARRTAEEALALAISATGLGMFDHYPQTGVMIWNPEMKRNFGMPADADVNFERVMQGIHPDDREDVERTLAQASSDNADGRFHIEHRVLDAVNGGERWLQVQGRYFFDVAGQPVRCVGTALDVSERKRTEERIRQAALHDPLTGLPNRGWLFESARHLFGRARRASLDAGVLFIDLDRFKPINDNYGHEVGDKVLQEVAHRLGTCVREEDLVVRLG